MTGKAVMQVRAPERFIGTVADIVAAYVSKNALPAADLPSFIQNIHNTLVNIEAGVQPQEEAQALVPAVPIKKSITPEYLICLEDGRKFKSLRRHLGTTYNLSPDDYRRRWGLPSDYPMVAPTYSAQRSSLAKAIGLGKGRGLIVEPTKAKSRSSAQDETN